VIGVEIKRGGFEVINDRRTVRVVEWMEGVVKVVEQGVSNRNGKH